MPGRWAPRAVPEPGSGGPVLDPREVSALAWWRPAAQARIFRAAGIELHPLHHTATRAGPPVLSATAQMLAGPRSETRLGRHRKGCREAGCRRDRDSSPRPRHLVEDRCRGDVDALGDLAMAVAEELQPEPAPRARSRPIGKPAMSFFPAGSRWSLPLRRCSACTSRHLGRPPRPRPASSQSTPSDGLGLARVRGSLVSAGCEATS